MPDINLSLYIQVPILVTKMLKSQIAADVCLNTESESTLKTTEWLLAYPDLKALYLVLKHGLSSLKVDSYLRFHMMDSKSQGIAGFTLICLIVRYLQASISNLTEGFDITHLTASSSTSKQIRNRT